METIQYRRQGTMSQSAYIRAIAFFTLIVASFVAGGCVLSYGWQFSLPTLIGEFVGSIVCIFVFKGSYNPVISFIGVGCMALLLGLMTGPSLIHYKMHSIVSAVVITGLIMVVMSVVGIVVPQVFRGFGPYLLGGLVLLIILQFSQLIFISLGYTEAFSMPILNWIGIFLFTMFVAYDWSQALDQEYTLDNAIDASGGLILDAVNLFVRILSDSSSSSLSDD